MTDVCEFFPFWTFSRSFRTASKEWANRWKWASSKRNVRVKEGLLISMLPQNSTFTIYY